MNTVPPQQPSTAPLAPTEYHVLAVEAVMTLDELEREVHYAGVDVSNTA